MSRLDSGYGSGFSSTLWTTAKIDAFAPIASARVSMAVRVKSGARTSRRAACRISWRIASMGSLDDAGWLFVWAWGSGSWFRVWGSGSSCDRDLLGGVWAPSRSRVAVARSPRYGFFETEFAVTDEPVDVVEPCTFLKAIVSGVAPLVLPQMTVLPDDVPTVSLPQMTVSAHDCGSLQTVLLPQITVSLQVT